MRRIWIGVAACIGLGFALGLGMTSYAHSFPGVKQVFVQSLEGEDNLELRVIRLDFDPGAFSPPHRHPGHVIVHVLEGTIVNKLDDNPEVVYKAGETFYEAPGTLHALSRNPSATKSAKAIAFMIIDKDAPSTVLELGNSEK